MPEFTLFRPMPGLPWYLLPIWPLIYLRIQRLRAWFKANGGPGSQMLWAVTSHGRVDLVFLSDDMTGHPSGSFRAPVSDRLAHALAGEDLLSRPVRLSQRTLGSSPAGASLCGSGPQLSLGIRLFVEKLGPIPDT
ncbi:MAG: hypothetical protein V7651_07540 [Hyphomonas oceanitis]|uniref:hypothetical protein n=1 Tax=Hyphomonas oceanitis TaxID=81033 RepID=UPI0030019EAB